MKQDAASPLVNVLIVEDNPVTLRALCLSIESDPALKLVAFFDTIKPALEWLQTEQPDVLLTDLDLPDGSGLEIIDDCSRRYPECEIMVLTVSSDEENVVASIEAGASGYLLKNAGKVDIVSAVMNLCAGGAPMSPAIARMVLTRIRDGKKPEALAAAKSIDSNGLTIREIAILDLIAKGESYVEVARMLALSVGTIQTHIKKIYRKLSVNSRGEAVFEAHRQGLLQAGPNNALEDEV
ncbi:MAG TPA: response regulator transcription factor [Burkholderiaceae bacterium]|jgi:DNA-binding NarL/FixJ family response regulator